MKNSALHALFTLTVVALLATTVEAQRNDFRRVADTIKPGDAAPDFALKMLDGKDTVTLSKFKNDRPVALIFGSYT